MRIDKYLAEMGIGSRKEAKELLRKGQVTVNDKQVKEGKYQVDEQSDQVAFAGKQLFYQENYYYMLHKPKGVISATEDKRERTVMELLCDSDRKKGLFPVGRLDKDTEGLLLLTTDGQFAHQLVSSKKHVDKEYFAKIRGLVSSADQAYFSQGFKLNSTERVKPSRLFIDSVDEVAGISTIRLVIQEGKFHQVKRMFEKIGKKVIYLKRLRMGGLVLDEQLPLGQYRPLTIEEIQALAPQKLNEERREK